MEGQETQRSLSWSCPGRITPSKPFSRWAGSFLSHDLLLGPAGRSEVWEAKESPGEETLVWSGTGRKESVSRHSYLVAG